MKALASTLGFFACAVAGIFVPWRLLTCAMAFLVCAATATAVPVTGAVEFRTEDTTGFVVINGTGGVVTGDTDGKLTVDLAVFDTADKLRNEHMRDKYLEVAKYPKATLELDAVKPAPEFEWTGRLTIKNETKPVKGKAKLAGSDLWAEFTIKLSDYPAVGVPEWKGITVARDVRITVKAKTK